VQALEALAAARRLQGRYSAAEPIQQRCLELARETLGEEDLDYASALYGLGMLYRCQGRVDDAERLFDKAEEVLDSRHHRLRKAS
jgi:tetratricopeptide (TPR) repeat protein